MRYESELLVFFERLKNNITKIKNKAKNNEIIYMVKANAYGHGLLPISKFIENKMDGKYFGVASIGEAKKLLPELQNSKSKIFVFSELCLRDKTQIYETTSQVVPVLAAMDDLEFFLETEIFKKIPLVLKFNTGMNRLGFSESEVQEVISLCKKYERMDIFHIMTHFANSFLPISGKDRTTKQYALFVRIKQELLKAGFNIEQSSCSNSGAIEQEFGLDETHIRPGLMLYGPYSCFKNRAWYGETISDLRTKIIRIEKVKRGQPIGYGSFVCHDNGYLIYLPLGYGDGILTYYSGKDFYIDETKVRIMGRVNMDLTLLFCKELPDNWCVGKELHWWDSGKNDISKFAEAVKTHQYQIFTAITDRVPRRYHN